MPPIGIIGFGASGQAHAVSWSCVPGCGVTKVFDPKPAAATCRPAGVESYRTNRPVTVPELES